MNDLVTLILIATLLVLGYGVLAYRRTRDVFHPSILFALLCTMMYVILPGYLMLTQGAEVALFLSQDQIVTALSVVLAVLFGCIVGFWAASRRQSAVTLSLHSCEARIDQRYGRRIVTAGLIFLFLGALGYVMNLADYGWASVLAVDAERYAEERPTGYLGELTHALLPAALIGGFLWARSPYRRVGLLVLLLGLFPWMLSAVAGGRRGPAIIALAGLLFATFFWRRSLRPSIFVAWVSLLALVVTFLIANRGVLEQGRYGTWAELSEAIYLNVFEGNEFVYGSAAIALRAETGEFYWGRRHVMTYLVRPVPRQLWPTKYEDAAEWLGLPDWRESNHAVFPSTAAFVLGWTAPLGAAPGLAADLWIDWGPAAPIAGGVITYLLTLLWWRARMGQICTGVLYGVAFVLMAYLVTQGLEAFLVRFLFVALVVLAVLRACGVPLRSALDSRYAARAEVYSEASPAGALPLNDKVAWSHSNGPHRSVPSRHTQGLKIGLRR